MRLLIYIFLWIIVASGLYSLAKNEMAKQGHDKQFKQHDSLLKLAK